MIKGVYNTSLRAILEKRKGGGKKRLDRKRTETGKGRGV